MPVLLACRAFRAAAGLALALATALPAGAASSTLVAVEDGLRSHAGGSGSVLRLGAGTVGGTVGPDPARSESWIDSAYGGAYARADLATASLHAATRSTAAWTPPTVDGSLARAVMRDVLSFGGPGVDPNGVIRIEVIWRQQGVVSERLNAGWRSTLNLLGKGGMVFERHMAFDNTPGTSLLDRDRWTLSAPDLLNPLQMLPWQTRGTPDGDFLAHGFVDVSGSDPQLALEAGFETSSSLGSSTDFAGSVYLSVRPPANVSLSSQSGLFMTAVPEPGTAALLLLGLAAVATRGRFRILAA